MTLFANCSRFCNSAPGRFRRIVLTPSSPTQCRLQQRTSSSTSYSVIASWTGFTGGYFPLQPLRFFSSAVLSLPLDYVYRASLAILSAVDQWSFIPSRGKSFHFLLSALKNLAANNHGFSILILDTIHAEVLVSLHSIFAALVVRAVVRRRAQNRHDHY